MIKECIVIGNGIKLLYLDSISFSCCLLYSRIYVVRNAFRSYIFIVTKNYITVT